MIHPVVYVPHHKVQPGPAPGPAPAVDLTDIVWNNWYSPGMPPQVQWSAGYPLTGQLHYVTTPFGSILGFSFIRFTLEVTGPPMPVQADDIPPATARPWIGTTDTTWAHLRFWSEAHLTLQNGVQTVDVPIDANHWTTVDGSHDPAGFLSLAANPTNIGWTCGGQFFYGHGITGGGLVLRAYQLFT